MDAVAFVNNGCQLLVGVNNFFLDELQTVFFGVVDRPQLDRNKTVVVHKRCCLRFAVRSCATFIDYLGTQRSCLIGFNPRRIKAPQRG